MEFNTLEAIARKAAIEVLFHVPNTVTLDVVIQHTPGENGMYQMGASCNYSPQAIPKKEKLDLTVAEHIKNKFNDYLSAIQTEYLMMGIDFDCDRSENLLRTKVTLTLKKQDKRNYGRNQIEEIFGITTSQASDSPTYKSRKEYAIMDLPKIVRENLTTVEDPELFVYMKLLEYRIKISAQK